jgi:hypothetical protein
MGLLGFFSNNWQDDSKRPLVNKWLEKLEPPDLQSLNELNQDFEFDAGYQSAFSTSSSTHQSEETQPGMASPIQRHYDWSQVQVSSWQDPYRSYATPQYEASYSRGYNGVLDYQIADDSDSEDEDDEEGDDDIGTKHN